MDMKAIIHRRKKGKSHIFLRPEDNQKYKVRCWQCGHKFERALSIAQKYLSMKDVHETVCPYCRNAMKLTFDKKNKSFISERIENSLRRHQIEAMYILHGRIKYDDI